MSRGEWTQGTRVRIQVERAKGQHARLNGTIVWIVRKTNEQKSLGFIHPNADEDGVARQYEVLTAGGEMLRIWGKDLEAVERTAVSGG